MLKRYRQRDDTRRNRMDEVGSTNGKGSRTSYRTSFVALLFEKPKWASQRIDLPETDI